MLHNLNDDCLAEIFQYLNVSQQLIMTDVSERFTTVIVERFWRLKFHKFKTPYMVGCNKLTLNEFKKFYRLITPHITELYIENTSFIAFSKDLRRYHKRPNIDFYKNFEYPQLRMLFCNDEHFNNGYLKILSHKCPKLEMLEILSGNLTGQYLADITQLREIYIESFKLEPIYFEHLFNNQKISRIQLCGETTNISEMDKVLKAILPKITELHYYNQRDQLVSYDFFTISAELLGNLKKLSCSSSIEFLFSLHTLKELHIENDLELVDLLKLINNNADLEDLSISGGLSSYSMFSEWVCEISDRLRCQQRKNFLTLRLDCDQLLLKTLQQIVEKHDLQHGYVTPVLHIKSLAIKTFEVSPILYYPMGIVFALNWD